MTFTKNKKYQYLFFGILSVYTIFNGGNSNLFIQLNFILFGFLFIYCLRDKNYRLHLSNFINNNKISIFFYSLFIIYLFFQIIPLPVEMLKFISHEKYKFINILSNEISYTSISFHPSDSYFQTLNFITIFIVVLIFKMIFYTDRHINRLFIYLSFLGFISSLFAVILFLYGNTDFLIFKNLHYKDSSTGFFTNRTVFSIFLLICLVASLEILKKIHLDQDKKDDKNFFLKIYIRFFIIFITIGIITSFSRIGNFMLLITIFLYLTGISLSKNDNFKSFRNIILLIFLFDIIILGIYFGTSQIVDRFAFLNEEFSFYNIDNNSNITRLQIIKFSLYEIKNFLFFGYGSGAYEIIFQLKFSDTTTKFANHAHSDLIEYIGEFGLIGISLILLSLAKYFFKLNLNVVLLILISYLLIILFFDFALHIPIIQILFVIFFILNKNSKALHKFEDRYL